MFACSDSIKGYNIHSFSIYRQVSLRPTCEGFGYDVVMTLLDSLKNKGHVLFTDNFYSSPELFIALLNECAFASGTVRTTRKCNSYLRKVVN